MPESPPAAQREPGTGIGGPSTPVPPRARRRDDLGFLIGLGVLGGSYLLLIVLLFLADLAFIVGPQAGGGWLHPKALAVLSDPYVRHATVLSLLSCSLSTLIALWIAVPLGYCLSRLRIPGKAFIDALIDVPIVLPPLVVGLSLLVLFSTPPGHALDEIWQRWFGTRVSLAVPGVILAQVSVVAAFAARTMRTTFDELSPRTEQVAQVLGCTRAQAFWRVTLPAARRGMVTAGTLAWARSLGEFGPILVFCGASRGRTEVLSTTVYLESSTGNLAGAVMVSLLMVAAAVVTLIVVRVFGNRGLGGGF